MRDEYDIKNLNPRKNPYSKRLKKQVTLYINEDTVAYFKALAEKKGIPYQTLINLYLSDCAEHKRELSMNWN
jgi:predicted DNA binding CopG/RHH family protein